MRPKLCSFCGKWSTEVDKLVEGPGVQICDNCVRVCQMVIDKELGTHPMSGKERVCFLEIPANDIDRSAEFYKSVFGFRIRMLIDGRALFDDPTGELSGILVAGRTPSTATGLLVYIMVYNLSEILRAVIDNGGEVETADVEGGPGILAARIRDPAGNVIGLFEEPVPPPSDTKH